MSRVERVGNHGALTLQVGDFLHRRILPQRQLVLGVAVGRAQLLVLRVPHQARHLGASVHRFARLTAVQRVPEPDRAIGAAAASGQEVRLPGTPGQGLDRRLMAQGMRRALVLNGRPASQDQPPVIRSKSTGGFHELE